MGLLDWFRKKPRRRERRAEYPLNFFTQAGFAGARLDRMTDDWQPGNLSPNAIHRADATILRNRARDLVLNDPLAKSGVDAYITNVIESGITPKPLIDDDGARQMWTDAWNTWGVRRQESDITGHQTIYELSALWLEEIIVGGGCLLRFRNMQNRGRMLSACVELIPEERFADDRDTMVAFQNNRKSANPISRGVEVDSATGRPVAYWVKQFHPNDYSSSYATQIVDPIRIPADQCHYAFFRKRIGQNRGHTLMHAVITWLWKLGYYTDNELMASMVKSCFAAVITTENGIDDPDLLDADPDGTTTDAYGNPLEKIQPAMVAKLKIGEKISSVSPNVPQADSTPWLQMIERSIAIGMGLSYEEMARDYSKGNFSSTRASANADRKRYRPMQRFAINHFYQPVYEHFLRAAVLEGIDGFPSRQVFVSEFDNLVKCSWRAPGWQSVNPRDDAMANEINLRIGVDTRDGIIARSGNGDVDEVFQQRAREQALAEELGLSLVENEEASSESDEVMQDEQ